MTFYLGLDLVSQCGFRRIPFEFGRIPFDISNLWQAACSRLGSGSHGPGIIRHK